jgi:anti-sigma regulatory factor (Ser/Thr protein kinase)
MDICHYGFTEMFNNVIVHSSAEIVFVDAKFKNNLIVIHVYDNGVGIFNKIQKDFNLENPRHAILELAKGKLTSDSAKHTGEGIFFTSRMFDQFYISSGSLTFGRMEEKDWLLEQKESMKGTRITLKISLKSERIIQKVFDKFAAEKGDYGFTKTHLAVKLAQFEGETLISRSQAKRLLARFDKFKVVVLDFKGVETIGQPFADEIFRVFNIEHPDIKLDWINTTEQVEKMIKRALANR